MISASTRALEDVGLLLPLALDLLDLGLRLVDDLLLALFALAGRLDGDGFHQRDGAVEGGLAHLGHELDPRQADVDQLDAAARGLCPGHPRPAHAGRSRLICCVILSRPSETDSLASGGTIKSSMAWSGSATVGLFPGRAARGDHLRAGGPGCRSSCGWCSGRSRPGCCVVIVSRAVLRTNSLTRDSALGTVRQRPDELGGVGDLPDGPDRHLDLLAVGGGHVDELLILGRSRARPGGSWAAA